MCGLTRAIEELRYVVRGAIEGVTFVLDLGEFAVPRPELSQSGACPSGQSFSLVGHFRRRLLKDFIFGILAQRL